MRKSMSIYYIGITVYTIIWFIIWWLVLRYKNKEFECINEDYDKLEVKYNMLKDDYNRLEGRYEESCRITEQRISNSEPPLSSQGYLPN